MTQDRLQLIDVRLARIEDLLEVVVRIEERQVGLCKRFDAMEILVRTNAERVDVVERKVDTWIQRGVGLWVGVSTLAFVAWTVYTQFVNK